VAFGLFVLATVCAGGSVWMVLVCERPTTVWGPSGLSARDWPELRVDAVVVDPENPWRVLVLVRRPDRPIIRSLLVLETSGANSRAQRLLQEWRDADAPVAPERNGDRGVILRRRRCPEQLRARLVDESRAA
jgi:hypothetical protein